MPELPNGVDRADGLSGRLGTPDGLDSVILTKPIAIEESEESPEIERAEQATITHEFTLGWNEGLTRISGLGRGTLLYDSGGNITKVLSTRLKYIKGGRGNLRVTGELITTDSPPDQFQLVPVELGLNILKHPRYFYAFLGDGFGSTTEAQNQMVIRILQDYFENTTAAFRNAITQLLKDSIGYDAGVDTQPPSYPYSSTARVSGTDMAKRAALEIVQKYWRGEETPYIVGLQMVWSTFSYRPPLINLGGVVEDPILDATPQLPDYFFSTAFPPNFSNTIFDALTSYNPQCYSSTGLAGGPLSISWLRKADTLTYERTWFRLDRNWIGAPVGYWDPQLYNSGNRPQVPTDYLITA